ncbi:Zinc finger, RING-type [Dillenia turbinata]|uniref:RING-type E3 ubiquitin transferase n=1 Tax=Dillenia turbinata TaxID=194707 RepID=A0AAN8V8A8_9MAGN
MPDNSIVTEQGRLRLGRPRNVPISESNQNPQITSSLVQSIGCKSSISSLFLSTFTNNNNGNAINESEVSSINNKKKNLSFRGLGCGASPEVSLPVAIRSSAEWDEERRVNRKNKKKKIKIKKKMLKNETSSGGGTSASACVGADDVWCGVAASAADDCVVVPRRPVSVSTRPKIDSDKINRRERPSYAARSVHPDHYFLDSDPPFGTTRMGSDVFRARHHRHDRHRSPEGLAETLPMQIMMLQNSMLMGGRPDGLDQYREWRLDVDNMSYEELLELGDHIGYVSTGLREDQISRCLRKTKLPFINDLSARIHTEMELKCSVCQEEYGTDDEVGKLDCGHDYHIHCIRQWLVQKNTCPVCKASAAAQY